MQVLKEDRYERALEPKEPDPVKAIAHKMWLYLLITMNTCVVSPEEGEQFNKEICEEVDEYINKFFTVLNVEVDEGFYENKEEAFNNNDQFEISLLLELGEEQYPFKDTELENAFNNITINTDKIKEIELASYSLEETEWEKI